MEHLKRILLVGAGNIGSNYLKGLAEYHEKIEIVVVDISFDALQKAKSIIIKKDLEQTKIFSFESTLSSIKGTFDIAIITTLANSRANIVKNILDKCQVKSWILEKVLSQSLEDLDSISHSLKNNKNIWINLPRRVMRWHQLINHNLISKDEKIIEINIEGYQWGLACNSIHFIDLISWWTKSKIISINNNELTSWDESKRKDIKEVYGMLSVKYESGALLKMNCLKSHKKPFVEIKLKTNRGIWLINEINGTAIDPDGLNINGRIEYQSQLISPVVNNILYKNYCLLTTLNESIEHHRFLLSSLISNWNKFYNLNDKKVPIT